MTYHCDRSVFFRLLQLAKGALFGVLVAQARIGRVYGLLQLLAFLLAFALQQLLLAPLAQPIRFFLLVFALDFAPDMIFNKRQISFK